MTILNDLEFWKLILNVVQIIMLAGIGAAGAAYKYSIDHRTDRWEKMTQRAVDSSEEAVSLIQQNTELTRKIQTQGDGLQERLNKMTAASSYAKGHLRGSIDAKEKIEKDDLDKIETEAKKITE